ncbi:hypothetical protein BH10PSE19_BH10PSE19_19520 [soil metagenome]
MAEIDYVMAYGSEIVPIEVKANIKARLKSLQQFMHEKASKIGVVISQRPLQQDQNILYVPFYLISQIPRFIHDIV